MNDSRLVVRPDYLESLRILDAKYTWRLLSKYCRSRMSLIQHRREWCRVKGVRHQGTASNTTNTLSATLYLLLINETGYLLSNKETLLVRDTLAGTLPGLYPVTCKYRGFHVILSGDRPDTFYLSRLSSIARILHALTETFPKRTANRDSIRTVQQQFCT